uniref:TlpA family protein disulfide reductase n=1 Tax=Schlesneria paludicola TaxID=360056 RepID=A0A7C4LMZ1_9PLAN
MSGRAVRWMLVTFLLGLVGTGCGTPSTSTSAPSTGAAPTAGAKEVEPTADGTTTAGESTADHMPLLPETAATTDAAPNDTAAGATTTAAEATPTAPEASAATVNLRLQDWPAFAEWLSQQRGKVVVVDVWSTSCEPCVREFPQLVALQARYPDDVLAVGLNCDYVGIKKKPPESYRGKVEKFLGEVRAEQVVNVLCTTPSDDVFAALNISSIPAVFVYDREGKQVHLFDSRSLLGEGEGVSYEKHVVPAVTALVESK